MNECGLVLKTLLSNREAVELACKRTEGGLCPVEPDSAYATPCLPGKCLIWPFLQAMCVS